MIKGGITVHSVFRNEERFAWYSLMSVIDYVDQILVFDTGSTDKTVRIIKSIRSPKIILEQKGMVDRKGLVDLRQEQIDRTKTEWIYLLDGDEVYPDKTIQRVCAQIKNAELEQVGLFLPFYNLVGDIYHRQKEKYGKYVIGEKRGHINLRGLRRTPGLKLMGSYPLEAYVNREGKKIQDVDKRQLIYVDEPYWHAGNLLRSHEDKGVLERRIVFDIGIKIRDQIPEVLSQKRPHSVPQVDVKRSLGFILASLFLYGLRELKNLK